MAITVLSPKCPRNFIYFQFHEVSNDFRLKQCSRLSCFSFSRPSLFNSFKRKMRWSVRSSLDSNAADPSSLPNGGNGTTRLIRAIQGLRTRLGSRIREIRKGFALKLFFFLVGFYCATAFATVIGQTGDWDVLSAALAVVIVEGIGALMYRASFPLFAKIRSLVTVFNYWKTGLTLGLFLDSFKYGIEDVFRFANPFDLGFDDMFSIFS